MLKKFEYKIYIDLFSLEPIIFLPQLFQYSGWNSVYVVLFLSYSWAFVFVICIFGMSVMIFLSRLHSWIEMFTCGSY